MYKNECKKKLKRKFITFSKRKKQEQALLVSIRAAHHLFCLLGLVGSHSTPQLLLKPGTSLSGGTGAELFLAAGRNGTLIVTTEMTWVCDLSLTWERQACLS